MKSVKRIGLGTFLLLTSLGGHAATNKRPIPTPPSNNIKDVK